MALKGTEQGEVWGGDIGVFGPKGGGGDSNAC